VHGSHLYLGNYQTPGRLLKVNKDLKIRESVSLAGFQTFPIYKGSYLQIDSPHIYLMDGIKPVIIEGDLPSLHLKKTIRTSYFTGAIAINNHSFILRSVYNGIGNVIVRQENNTDSLKKRILLEKQVDGVFCTDGEMIKVPGSLRFIYVYYYRNQFLCTDSHLNLIYKGKTIDTIGRAHIKVTKIASTGETTMSAPPLYVNKRACANSKYLFVQSALRANNETEYMIKNVSMIDVYAVFDGKYKFSFYLPDFRGHKVRDFKVYGKSLYALYDHYLYKYKLNF